MAIRIKSCGRKFTHEPHIWSEPVLHVDYSNWPKFQCQGVQNGPTEQEFLLGLHAQIQAAPIEDTEETPSDAARRFALKLDQISKMEPKLAAGMDPKELVIKLSDLNAILYPED